MCRTLRKPSLPCPTCPRPLPGGTSARSAPKLRERARPIPTRRKRKRRTPGRDPQIPEGSPDAAPAPPNGRPSPRPSVSSPPAPSAQPHAATRRANKRRLRPRRRRLVEAHAGDLAANARRKSRIGIFAAVKANVGRSRNTRACALKPPPAHPPTTVPLSEAFLALPQRTSANRAGSPVPVSPCCFCAWRCSASACWRRLRYTRSAACLPKTNRQPLFPPRNPQLPRRETISHARDHAEIRLLKSCSL